MGDQFALARYNPDGSLDVRFGEGGKLLTDFVSSADERVHAIVIDDQGRIVAGGWAWRAICRMAGSMRILARMGRF
jgi:hypothetical protein